MMRGPFARDAFRGVFGAGVMVLLFGLSAAIAATPPAGDNRPDPFNLLDHNNDGFISYSEAKSDPALAEEFNRLDTDKNGELDRGEFAQFEAQGLTNSPNILPPEPSEHVEKAPPLPPQNRQLTPPPPEPAPFGPTATDRMPRP